MKPLTRRQFQGLIKKRGYTQAEVAKLFELSNVRLSQIARDPERAMHYDYALWGLPPKAIAAAVAARRELAVREYSSAADSTRAPAPHLQDIWSEIEDIGAVYIVRSEQGEHLPEGCEGVVVTREVHGDTARVTIRFDSGHSESFPVSYLRGPECFLAATGKVREGTPPASEARPFKA
jgi:hypothetical protein